MHRFPLFPALTVVLACTALAAPKAAAVGMVYAQILYPFVPGNRDEVREIGTTLGNDRVMAGQHWPSDVEAGQRLGRAFATWWISQPEIRARIVEASREEWHHRR